MDISAADRARLFAWQLEDNLETFRKVLTSRILGEDRMTNSLRQKHIFVELVSVEMAACRKPGCQTNFELAQYRVAMRTHGLNQFWQSSSIGRYLCVVPRPIMRKSGQPADFW